MSGLELAALLLLAAAGLGGCRGANPIVGPPPQPAVKPYVIPADANFLLVVSEAVGGPEEDLPSYTKIYIDGKPAGQTSIEPKSKEKKWGERLDVGNHLFRFEQWVLPFPGEWTPLAAQWQPPERFIRVEPGLRTTLTLKLFDGGRRHSTQIARSAAQSSP